MTIRAQRTRKNKKEKLFFTREKKSCEEDTAHIPVKVKRVDLLSLKGLQESGLYVQKLLSKTKCDEDTGHMPEEVKGRIC
jgi:hypothetical protein